MYSNPELSTNPITLCDILVFLATFNCISLLLFKEWKLKGKISNSEDM